MGPAITLALGLLGPQKGCAPTLLATPTSVMTVCDCLVHCKPTLRLGWMYSIITAYWSRFAKLCLVLQVFGMFAVLATATGCLYFMDPSNVASPSGLEAVGVLLLILNILYVLATAALVTTIGAHKAKKMVHLAATTATTAATAVGELSTLSVLSLSRKKRGQVPDREADLPVSASTGESSSGNAWLHRRVSSKRLAEPSRTSSAQMALLSSGVGSSVAPVWLNPDDAQAADDQEASVSVLSVLPHEQKL